MTFLLSTALAAAPALADAEAIAVRATTATSERTGKDFRESAIGAFDGDAYPGVFSRWCTANEKAEGQSVTLQLASPQRIDSVTIWTAPGYAPIRSIDIKTDTQTVTVRPDADGSASATLTGETARVTLRLGPVDLTKGQRFGCIADVALIRAGHRLTLLHGVPTEAATQLPAAISAIDAAVARCDAAALATVARFPFAYDFIGPADAPAHATHADAAALAKHCANRGMGRAVVDRVTTTVGVPGQTVAVTNDQRRWNLVWQGGRWQFVGVAGTGPGGLQ